MSIPLPLVCVRYHVSGVPLLTWLPLILALCCTLLTFAVSSALSKHCVGVQACAFYFLGQFATPIPIAIACLNCCSIICIRKARIFSFPVSYWQGVKYSSRNHLWTPPEQGIFDQFFKISISIDLPHPASKYRDHLSLIKSTSVLSPKGPTGSPHLRQHPLHM